MHHTAARALRVPLLLAFALPLSAQVGNLRIAEIQPDTGQLEVLNTGPAFTTIGPRPFCHRLIYTSGIPVGTAFAAGGRVVLPVTALNAVDSDMWLYTSGPFFLGANIINGLKWGPQPNVGRTGLAASNGLWDSAASYVPSPGPGRTLAWDGFGDTSGDWYVDETPTLGGPDSTTPGSTPNALQYPGGTQTFESMLLGDEVFALSGWVFLNTGASPGAFTVRDVNDLRGDDTPRVGSEEWLRVHDQDAAAAQNEFWSATVSAPAVEDYTWNFDLNLEATPPGGAATKPRLLVQHLQGGLNFVGTWGLELASTGVSLVVTADGGTPASAALYGLASPTAVGDWVEIELSVDVTAGTVSASANGGAPVSLPIAPAAGVSLADLRVGFDGGGNGNVSRLLLDDLCVFFPSPASATVRNGTGVNPLAFSSVTPPILGQAWNSQVSLGGAVASLVWLGLGGPTQGFVFSAGELLILGPTIGPDVQFGTHAFPLPPNCNLIGAAITSQAATFAPGNLQLTNALDLVLGTE